MYSIVNILLFVSAMLAFSQDPNSDNSSGLPAIEYYNNMQAGDWHGRKFKEIISPAEIDRILVLKHAHRGGVWNQISSQSGYQDLISHLLASDFNADNIRWLATETPVSTLIITTKNGQIYYLEIIVDSAKGISAVTMNGPGKGARFGLEGYKVKLFRK